MSLAHDGTRPHWKNVAAFPFPLPDSMIATIGCVGAMLKRGCTFNAGETSE